MKGQYVFINIDGVVMPQLLDSEEAGTVLRSVLKQNAIVLPVVCRASNNQDALAIYKEKVVGNLEMIELSTKKEAVHVQ
ncbi:hypothetical protein [Vibrio sonorensis]|uniref:hypothetical protein n=1 Tax=Vibrio sonorensis TaxID=1004316 RepID=UPI0008D8F768|nr:hypothetical protein [Vibrio sonorensis]